ncbi:Trp biosynthesis-associated membrane protein [Actinomadura rupiterrae]|uniref:Trp biosynthesis-associated membrane protein n=1 Tax=Actinomadura rupiterrae TaxID=559627 RepID=UPI0020A47A9F|nr:Trp biosynthesis-associated membrane protein [Actinomadura rupiterrae]MCP2338219.1 putative membrane protein (TIGR02234 family) [Actinomadura rupiterrae]
MTPARERGVAALVCAAGAGLTLLAAGQRWATVRAENAITPFTQHLSGHDLGQFASALGWAGLAGLAALFATSGRVRAAVGLLLALFGAGVVVASVTASRPAHVAKVAGEKSALMKLGAHPVVHVEPWWGLSMAGGVLLATAGLIVLVKGSRWPGLSARYARPEQAARPVSARSGEDAADKKGADDASALWKSLDRGEDPTADEDAADTAKRRR